MRMQMLGGGGGAGEGGRGSYEGGGSDFSRGPRNQPARRRELANAPAPAQIPNDFGGMPDDDIPF